ncbi:uncharacterized protein BO97DRAFT_204312 [Aspergillus homomorphus CBS 101889]|uniref:Uncharacterized protein n=1 Tax=Aspergillus homomorphus (strain CBS 101889) TaxID=1450537 RepID=A0A395HLW2_ASPHC|nr:hypothetical protein BO97DRAFT_204312 [Aspergillus homomorphus CBS 101889]RAL08413.1 hypothetical protein BO97DRAFT_204312 [Aspergillus homomorphus CBS 101889]
MILPRGRAVPILLLQTTSSLNLFDFRLYPEPFCHLCWSLHHITIMSGTSSPRVANQAKATSKQQQQEYHCFLRLVYILLASISPYSFTICSIFSLSLLVFCF